MERQDSPDRHEYTEKKIGEDRHDDLTIIALRDDQRRPLSKTLKITRKSSIGGSVDAS